MAALQVLVHEKTPLGEGYNTYDVKTNRREWQPYIDESGEVMRDSETGEPMVALKMVPGTRLCAYKFRIMYHLLKKAWKAANSG
jgi:hypothetical protein